MDIKGDRVRHDKTIRKIVLSIIIIIVTLNTNIFKVRAEVNNNLNMDLNNRLYSNSNNISDNVLDNLMVALTGKVNGYEVMLNEDVIGYTVSESDLDKVKENLIKKYINKNSIREDMVRSAQVKGNINLREERFDIEKLQSNEELVDKIYSLIEMDSQDIKINIKYVKEEVNTIEPSTLIIPTDELYIGESKVEEGEYGVKKVLKEITIESGEITNTRVLNQEIIKEQVSKKIYRGSKNPYEDGVAFLSHPTRGGYMTSGYGERWNSFHKGIDIAGDIGDDVIVALDGEVIYSQFNDGGYGNLIIVKHDDDMSTYYGHLSSFDVKVGDKVKKGNIIGKVGNTGFSTGPHLHFELRINDNPVDPTNYIVQ
ncbi:peptidoglycan DD-metalloendopeptidase family protein [Clostridium sp. Sa3CUN1]|uniref:Peptidoglycan DD-metalloendopeptidase family protein n=1 Tax=Clostridium gallinarum TaxID=2762246 RepID=A0ABR8Q736_9CLOT|nr:peptidoglycan DD-metalloendopeptidase family protein [Clostridium gallinarum]MBD7916241.1 peptidoglycan DD-metalloendopeptidase family protein [Clostridium gallinarum]